MPKIEIRPLKHDQYDDLVASLGMTRAQLAKLCGISQHSIGWWRHTEAIPAEHFKKVSDALEKKLKGRNDLSAVEHRALTFVRLAMGGGSSSFAPNSPFASTFQIDSAPQMPAKTKLDLNKVDLADLIAAIKRYGGVVTFGGGGGSKKLRKKKSKPSVSK